VLCDWSRLKHTCSKTHHREPSAESSSGPDSSAARDDAFETPTNRLLAGDAETADVAVAAVWGLVKGNPKLLRPEADALGTRGVDLIAPLLDIILRAKVPLAEASWGVA